MTPSPLLPTPSAPRTVAAVISAARTTQDQTLQDFAETLGVTSKQNVSNWERGVNEPDATVVNNWLRDEREWVRELAVEIFVARYRAALIKVFDVPDNAPTPVAA